MKKYFKYLFTILFTVCFARIEAQENCISSDVRTGCIPFTVQLEYCGPLQEDNKPFPTIYRYGDGVQTSSTTHTYTEEGLFSITQRIAFQPGVILDSTFKDFFRAVAQPSFEVAITNCKDKNVQIKIDSNSYDFYLIGNNLNSTIDTLFGFGSKALSFSAETQNEITFTITGKYFDATCEFSRIIEHLLVDEIIPNSITKVSEFKEASVVFSQVSDVSYEFSLLQNGASIQSITDKNTNNLSLSNEVGYDQMLFTAVDDCQNKDTVLLLESFKSETIFENNQNTVNHTSSVFSPTLLTYIKLNTDTTRLLSNVDLDITCGSTDCYFIETNAFQNNYDFTRYSTGDCGTSFSLDIPIIESIAIDNSNNSSTIVAIKSSSDIDLVNINTQIISDANNGNLSLDYTQNCLDITITNSCNQTSSVMTKCPLILESTNNLLSWNNIASDSYSLFWISTIGDTNVLALNLSSTYNLDPKNYVAQEFCLYVQNSNDFSMSNTLCFQDLPFIFIPDLAFLSNEELKIENKYLSSFNLKLFDLNGNLQKEWNQNSKLNLQNLDIGTYFYIFEGISENNSVLNTKGTILIKN